MAKVVEQRAVRRRRFTVEEYHKMGEAGILGENDRVELIDGEVVVVVMSPIGWRHMWCIRRLIRVLAGFANDHPDARYEADAQNPILLDDNGEPRPDLALLRAPPIGRLPGPEEVLLVVEVADSSLAYDRDVKLQRYAEAGIPETWLADLNANRFEVHSEPGPDGYRKTTRFTRADRVESATLQGLAFAADEVLPPGEPEA